MNLPLDHPTRSYRDESPKPEVIIALTQFTGLAGFSEPLKTAKLFDALTKADPLVARWIDPLRGPDPRNGLKEVFLRALNAESRFDVLTKVVTAAEQLNGDDALATFAKTALDLHQHFPDDPTILAALLLNRFTLEPGEALSVKAGIVHAYLQGTGVEVMANSDNVLRGGLTKKHIDIPSLQEVIDYRPYKPDVLKLDTTAELTRYRTYIPEFEIWQASPAESSRISLPREDSDRIILVTEGSLTLHNLTTTIRLDRGTAAFLSAGDAVKVTGVGKLFCVSTGS